MIEFIGIKNFKTLLDANFPLGQLNLFSGINGMGKSTLIQSLLLLRQSYERNTLKDKGLLLNGDYLNIGLGQDVLSSFSDKEEITFVVKWTKEDSPFKFEFEYKHNSDLLPLVIRDVELNYVEHSLFNSNFQYLCAERIGPKSHHQLSEFHIRDLKSIGQHGEYTVHFIAVNGNQKLNIGELRHKNATSDTLHANIEAWMSELSPGLKINAQIQTQFNSVSLSYCFKQGNQITEDFKPQNVGFGLSYVLPVVTSILSASENDLLIIENPESHLHPAGQSLIGKLCAIAANNGVQLIIESHSDHFLNGIRVAVKQKIVASSDIKIFFLHRDINNPLHAAEVIYPNINEDGRIDCWPEGFFDQWDIALDKLL